MKPNILICGLYGISDILRDALPEDFILESENDDAVTKDVEDQETNMVNRIVETPVANFIEANEICRFYPEGFPAGLSMGDYVKIIEAELESRKLLNGTEKKIDFVWYSFSGCSECRDDYEEDFVRSAACLPNVLILANGFSGMSRSDCKPDIDAMTMLAGIRRCVLPQNSSGTFIQLIPSGDRALIEKTRELYLDSVNASAKEENAYNAAWKKFFGKQIKQWKKKEEEDVDRCIRQAVGQAKFILSKPVNMRLDDLVEEGVSLQSDLVEILKGGEPEDRIGIRKLAHVSELQDNLETMIYEIAACYGLPTDKSSMKWILKMSKAVDLPKKPLAVTYAVGKVARAVFIPDIKYKDYKDEDFRRIAREARVEARQMTFPLFEYEKPYRESDVIDDDDFGMLNDSDSKKDVKTEIEVLKTLVAKLVDEKSRSICNDDDYDECDGDCIPVKTSKKRKGGVRANKKPGKSKK